MAAPHLDDQAQSAADPSQRVVQREPPLDHEVAVLLVSLGRAHEEGAEVHVNQADGVVGSVDVVVHHLLRQAEARSAVRCGTVRCGVVLRGAVEHPRLGGFNEKGEECCRRGGYLPIPYVVCTHVLRMGACCQRYISARK